MILKVFLIPVTYVRNFSQLFGYFTLDFQNHQWITTKNYVGNICHNSIDGVVICVLWLYSPSISCIIVFLVLLYRQPYGHVLKLSIEKIRNSVKVAFFQIFLFCQDVCGRELQGTGQTEPTASGQVHCGWQTV